MKTELKVKASAFATYVASLAASAFLAGTATDFVHGLPDWLEVLVYPFIPAAASWVAGYAKRNRADSLSPSTRQAAEQWIRARASRP